MAVLHRDRAGFYGGSFRPGKFYPYNIKGASAVAKTPTTPERAADPPVSAAKRRTDTAVVEKRTGIKTEVKREANQLAVTKAYGGSEGKTGNAYIQHVLDQYEGDTKKQEWFWELLHPSWQAKFLEDNPHSQFGLDLVDPHN